MAWLSKSFQFYASSWKKEKKALPIMEIIEAKIIKVTPNEIVGCRSTQKPGMVCRDEWRDSKGLSWICPPAFRGFDLSSLLSR